MNSPDSKSEGPPKRRSRTFFSATLPFQIPPITQQYMKKKKIFSKLDRGLKYSKEHDKTHVNINLRRTKSDTLTLAPNVITHSRTPIIELLKPKDNPDAMAFPSVNPPLMKRYSAGSVLSTLHEAANSGSSRLSSQFDSMSVNFENDEKKDYLLDEPISMVANIKQLQDLQDDYKFDLGTINEQDDNNNGNHTDSAMPISTMLPYINSSRSASFIARNGLNGLNGFNHFYSNQSSGRSSERSSVSCSDRSMIIFDVPNGNEFARHSTADEEYSVSLGLGLATSGDNDTCVDDYADDYADNDDDDDEDDWQIEMYDDESDILTGMEEFHPYSGRATDAFSEEDDLDIDEII